MNAENKAKAEQLLARASKLASEVFNHPEVRGGRTSLGQAARELALAVSAAKAAADWAEVTSKPRDPSEPNPGTTLGAAIATLVTERAKPAKPARKGKAKR